MSRSNGSNGTAVPASVPPAPASAPAPASSASKRFQVTISRAYQVYAESEAEARRKTLEYVRTGRDGPAAREATILSVEALPPLAGEAAPVTVR